MIYFELIFVKSMQSCLNCLPPSLPLSLSLSPSFSLSLSFLIYLFIYLFIICRFLVVPTSFVEMTVFSSLNCICFFVKDQFTIFVWICFWALYSVPLIHLSLLSPIPHCLDYYSFIISVKDG